MTTHRIAPTRRMLPPAALALSLLTAVPAAHAEGTYVNLIGGLGWLGDTDIALDGGQEARGKFDAGFAGGASVGYAWENWRLEGELLYQTNDTDRASGPGLPEGADAGDFSSLAVGANAIYEFDLIGSPQARTYVGAGVVWLQEVDLDFDAPDGELSYSADDWGYQIFAGARYRFGEHWQVTAELRYLDAGSVSLDGEGAAPGRIKADYQRTSVLVGLGYRF